MNEEAPALRPALGHPGIDWSGDGGLGGPVVDREVASPEQRPVSAPLRLRAVGFGVDFLVLLGIVVVAMVIVMIAAGVDTSAPQAEVERQTEDLYPVLYVVGAAIQFVYNLVWNTIGWSPGKRTVGLRTVDRHGRPPGLGLGLLRTVGLMVGNVFGLGYLWAFVDRDRRTIHDRIGRTWVVRARAEDVGQER
ncbi:MAG: RDD family protein [Dehalococcoidia bacterium]|nr:RDD family protein [Dehalococcoidia bacterium]